MYTYNEIDVYYACSPPGGTQCPPFTVLVLVINTHYYYLFFMCELEMPFLFLKRKLMTAARFTGFWSTRNNHGQTPERRVCVLTCLLIGMSPPPPSRIPPPSLPPFYRLFSPYNHTTSDTHMDLLVNDEL